MEKVHIFGQVVIYMKGTGNIIIEPDLAHSNIQMGQVTKENLKITKSKAKVYILTRMESKKNRFGTRERW